jgi:hypothetical protein
MKFQKISVHLQPIEKRRGGGELSPPFVLAYDVYD